MSQSTDTTAAPDTTQAADDATANTAVPSTGGDRVAMLSLNSDGTVDQFNPQLIGDRDATLAATKAQFATQAVSAADSAAQRAELEEKAAGEPEQDPSISERTQTLDAAAAAGEAAAERVVDGLSS